MCVTAHEPPSHQADRRVPFVVVDVGAVRGPGFTTLAKAGEPLSGVACSDYRRCSRVMHTFHASACVVFVCVQCRLPHSFAARVPLSHSSRTQMHCVHSPPRGFALAFSTTTGEVSVLQPIFTVPPPLSTTSVGIPPAAAAPAIASLVCESKSSPQPCEAESVHQWGDCQDDLAKRESVGLLNIRG
jgi:hypothetical protein